MPVRLKRRFPLILNSGSGNGGRFRAVPRHRINRATFHLQQGGQSSAGQNLVLKSPSISSGE